MKALYIFQRSRRFGESPLGKTNIVLAASGGVTVTFNKQEE